MDMLYFHSIPTHEIINLVMGPDCENLPNMHENLSVNNQIFIFFELSNYKIV